MMRRTKIVATLGPATATPERIKQLIEAGMNVVRLNFSHGTHEEHEKNIRMVREAAHQTNRSIAILLDLQGPKIRTGALEEGKPVKLVPGQKFTITTRDVVGNAERVSTTYDMLPVDVRINGRVLLSDGWIELCVLKTSSTDVECEVIYGGHLREHQGINLPGVNVSAPAVTSKDVKDLHFGLEHEVDFIAISFVHTANDVKRVKSLIAQSGKETPVIAKIELPEAVEALEDILAVTDGIMVARGDLGVELPAEEVPIIQKKIIQETNRKGIPVITATQMLESMIHNPRPTRAEASDVANAILDGTDAVMLSGETATGTYPVETVQMMSLIAQHAEESSMHNTEKRTRPMLPGDMPAPLLAIGAASNAIVNNLHVAAIVVFTQSGITARLISQQRPTVPVLAFTHTEEVYRRLALLWGVQPILTELAPSLELFEQQVQTRLVQDGYAQSGDLVVMTGGHPIAQHGLTNFLKVVEIA